jgi:hypothetical protein
MSDATRNDLRAEAARSLRNYLATGLAGFLAKGLDRCRALNIRTADCEGSREGIEHLAMCLEIGWAA